MATLRLTRQALNSLVPNWLSNRPLLNNAFKYLYMVAVICDALRETAWEGLQAAYPGVGTETALPLIGQARGLIQGPFESNANFIQRLINYLTTWEGAGSPEALVTQIQDYLTPVSGPFPTVRVVDRNGNWCSISPTQVITLQVDSDWDWDSQSHPWHNEISAEWWGDIWIIITASPYATYTNLADANFVNAFEGQGSGDGLSHRVGRQDVSNILQIVKNWRGGHNYVSAIIWNTDPALFVPGSLGVAGNPDGYWGNWSKTVSGIRVQSRTTATGGGTVRYWTPGAQG